MKCGRCGESHTGGFMLVLEPPVCVYCYYRIAVASDQYGRKTRAQDRAEAEARDEIFDHLDASGHHGIRSRVKGNKIIMKCEECGLEVERKAALRAGLRRGDAGGLKP